MYALSKANTYPTSCCD